MPTHPQNQGGDDALNDRAADFRNPNPPPTNTRSGFSVLNDGFKSSYIAELFDTDKIGGQFRPEKGAFTVKVSREILFNRLETGLKHSAMLRPNCSFSATGARVRVINNDDGHGKFYGYDRKMIDADGCFLGQEALLEQCKNYYDRYLTGRQVRADVINFKTRDSHVSHIYNMLTTWLYMYIGECTATGRQNVRIQQDTVEVTRPDGTVRREEDPHSDPFFEVKMVATGYNSSHHNVLNNNGMEDGSDFSVKVTLPYHFTANDFNYASRNSENFLMSNFVISLPMMEPRAAAFILGHVGGRKGDNRVNFDIPVPPVTLGLIAVDTQGHSLQAIMDYVYRKEIFSNSNDLMRWIQRYVTHNRLQYDFTLALEMLMRLAFLPTAHSMEAMWWVQNMVYTVSLPSYMPTRALLLTNLEGEPYFVHNELNSVMLRSQNDIGDIMLCAAITNYYVAYGIYALLDNEMINIDNWRDTFTGTSMVHSILDNFNAYTTVVKNIVGLDVQTIFDANAGIKYDLTGMETFRVENVIMMDDYVRNNSTIIPERRVVRINRLYAPVSGVLIDGAVNSRFRVTRHLAATMTIGKLYARSENQMDDDGILGRAQAFRYLNHVLSWGYRNDEENFDTWAPAHEWCVEPASVYDYRGRYVKEIRGLTERPSTTVRSAVPGADALMYEDFTVVKRIAQLEFLQFRSSRSAVTIINRKLSQVTKVQIMVPKQGTTESRPWVPLYDADGMQTEGFTSNNYQNVSRYPSTQQR